MATWYNLNKLPGHIYKIHEIKKSGNGPVEHTVHTYMQKDRALQHMKGIYSKMPQEYAPDVHHEFFATKHLVTPLGPERHGEILSSYSNGVYNDDPTHPRSEGQMYSAGSRAKHFGTEPIWETRYKEFE